jgi:carboxyl-terminal processing protease
MIFMKKIFLITTLLLSCILLFSSCTQEKGNGILGIEVPIGSGRVSAETPYIISGVYEDTPAFKAGLKPGDLIIQINDMPISNGMKFDEIFSRHLVGKPGTKVTIYVKRGSENQIFEVIRAERGN